jgi:hypothetical protein
MGCVALLSARWDNVAAVVEVGMIGHMVLTTIGAISRSSVSRLVFTDRGFLTSFIVRGVIS